MISIQLLEMTFEIKVVSVKFLTFEMLTENSFQLK